MPVVGAMAGDIVRPNYLYWANNERLLVAMSVPYHLQKVQRDKEQHEDFDIDDYFMFNRMISVNKDLSDSVILMEDEPGLRNNYSLSRLTNFLPNDENHVLMDAYRSNRRTLYRVNITTGEAEKVTNGSNLTRRFFSDEDGRPRFRFDYLPRSRAIILYEYSGDDEWKRVEKIYLNKDDEDSIDTAGLIAMYEDSLVYRRQNEANGFYELIVVDRETDEKSTLASLPDQDIRGALSDWRTDELVGYTVEKDYVRHVFFDERRQEQYDAMSAQVGDYNFTISDIAEDGGLALIRSWGPDNPGSYHLWDIGSQKLTLLANAHEKLAAGSLSVPALATYMARDGAPIRSYILFPKDYQKGDLYPTVLLPHGGPHARDRATYDYFAQFLSTSWSGNE